MYNEILEMKPIWQACLKLLLLARVISLAQKYVKVTITITIHLILFRIIVSSTENYRN